MRRLPLILLFDKGFLQGKLLSLIGLFFFFCHFVGAQQDAMQEVVDFGKNPGDLKMFVHTHLPTTKVKVPLVIVLHGCGETAKSAAALTGWNKIADNEGFIVVYPQQKWINNPNLCFNWFEDIDREKGKGECESIYQMIVFMQKQYPIDSSRIFITGLSAGGAMSVVMMATHPELFCAGASFAGGAYKIAQNVWDALNVLAGNKYMSKEKLIQNVQNQHPVYQGKYPRLILYQGDNDPVVNEKNADFLVNQWTGIHQTDTLPDAIIPKFKGITDITKMEYTNANGEVIVTRYKVDNLGHRLLVLPGEKEEEGGQLGVFGVNKGFHSTYQTAIDFGLVSPKIIAPK